MRFAALVLRRLAAQGPRCVDRLGNGMIVTADALHCQTETAQLIAQQRGAEYVLQVKGNQPSVENVARFAVPEKTPPFFLS